MSQPNVLIAFYSRGGVTEALALAIAEGAREAGAQVTLRRARELVSRDVMAKAPGWVENADRMDALYEAPTADDVVAADAVILGSATRFGMVSSELKAFLDSLGGIWGQGKTFGKVGAVFTSTSTPHGGNEATLLSLFATMSHFGFVIVPPGYGEPATFGAGSPYGPTAVSGMGGTMPTDADLAVARFQGRRVAQVAAALKNAG